MACDGPRLGVVGIVVAHHETIDGEGVLAGGDFGGEASQTGFHRTFVRMFDQFALDSGKALGVEPSHPCAPTDDVLFSIYQGEWYPLDVTLAHLVGVFQRQRTRGEVTRIGIVLATLHEEAFEVVVADDCLATNDCMTLIADSLRNAVDRTCKMGDVGADMAITTCDDLRQLTIVVGHDERQTIQFPRYPNRSFLSPFHEVANLFGLCQRECRKLVFLLLPRSGILGNFLRGRVGQGSACLVFQRFQFVETLVPLIVCHLL